jgi:DNA polymerase-3 subunit alpha
MGKKDAAKMQAKRDSFVQGCKSRGIPEKKATKIFEFIEYFAGYGFPKAHSTTYALLAYQTAYLKANYPRHFMAALLTIESQNSDKVALVPGRMPRPGRADAARRHQREPAAVRRPTRGVRFGLGAVKGAGEGAIRSILETRATLGGAITSCSRSPSTSTCGL